MKLFERIIHLILALGLGAYPVQAQERTVQIPVETITDKIRGGLLGQLLGNLNGLPYEFKYVREAGDLKNYVPSLLDGAFTDDDTDFEWVYVYTMQQKRQILLPYDDIETLWKERINRNIWSSNRYARHLMDLGLKPPVTGLVTFNPWAEFNVSGQFLCETFGLLAPAMPQTAAKIGLHYTQVAIDNEPAQTTQLFTAMIATAFVEKDLDRILEAGVAALDPASNTRQIVEDARRWHREHPGSWQEARRLLMEKYTQENSGRRDQNGTELNTGAILLAYLYGGGDFSETLKLAFNLGWDADCNAATLGTILGTRQGYRSMMAEGWRIVDRYRNTSRDGMPMDETITSFADRLVELFELVNESNGGKKMLAGQSPVYEIRPERPAPVRLVVSAESQRVALLKEYQPLLSGYLLKGDREEKARAAYLAVCLGLDKPLSEKYPQAWTEARTALSGYWRVMNNIFYGEFKSLHRLREKFVDAGFRKPPRPFTDQEIYGNVVVWKDPARLYP